MITPEPLFDPEWLEVPLHQKVADQMVDSAHLKLLQLSNLLKPMVILGQVDSYNLTSKTIKLAPGYIAHYESMIQSTTELDRKQQYYHRMQEWITTGNQSDIDSAKCNYVVVQTSWDKILDEGEDSFRFRSQKALGLLRKSIDMLKNQFVSCYPQLHFESFDQSKEDGESIIFEVKIKVSSK